MSLDWDFSFKYKITEFLLPLLDFILVISLIVHWKLEVFHLKLMVLVIGLYAVVFVSARILWFVLYVGAWTLKFTFLWFFQQLASFWSFSVWGTGRRLAVGKQRDCKGFLPSHLWLRNHLWQWLCILRTLHSRMCWPVPGLACRGGPVLALVVPSCLSVS